LEKGEGRKREAGKLYAYICVYSIIQRWFEIDEPLLVRCNKAEKGKKGRGEKGREKKGGR